MKCTHCGKPLATEKDFSDKVQMVRMKLLLDYLDATDEAVQRRLLIKLTAKCWWNTPLECYAWDNDAEARKKVALNRRSTRTSP